MNKILDRCPDCGRVKAASADDAMHGYCPKWYAVRDPEAKEDCMDCVNAVVKKAPQALTPEVPDFVAMAHRLFQESTIKHHIHPDGDHISLRTQYICKEAFELGAAQQRESDAGDSKTLEAIYGLFQIGANARKPSVLLTNIENANRRADCLSAIENKFFTIEIPSDDPEDEGVPTEECLFNWGQEPADYAEQFGTALAAHRLEGVPVDEIRFAATSLYSDCNVHRDKILNWLSTIGAK